MASRTPARTTGRATRKSRAEDILLGLSRDLGAVVPGEVRDLPAAIMRLAAAYRRGGALRPALVEAARRGLTDERAALELSWAREQVRLTLEEIVATAAGHGGARTDVPPPTLAWLLLAACEALALEPPEAVDDRLHGLTAFLRGPLPAPGGAEDGLTPPGPGR